MNETLATQIRQLCLERLRSGHHINYVLEMLYEVASEIEGAKDYIIAVDESKFAP